MARFAGIGLFGLVAIALWIYCILDVISSEESLVRNLPKTLWLVVVIFVPTVGSIAWLAVGRPLYAGFRPGDTRSRPRPSRPVARGPEDDPDFAPPWPADPTPAPDPAESEAVRERRLQEREAELERRERLLEERQAIDPEADPDATA